MPYITETELSNLQQKIDQLTWLVDRLQDALGYLIDAYDIHYDTGMSIEKAEEIITLMGYNVPSCQSE